MLVENDLSRILAVLQLPSASQEILRRRFADSVDLMAAGEPGVAMENLCDNLFEFDVALDGVSHRGLKELCLRYNVAQRRITLLDDLAARGAAVR